MFQSPPTSTSWMFISVLIHAQESKEMHRSWTEARCKTLPRHTIERLTHTWNAGETYKMCCLHSKIMRIYYECHIVIHLDVSTVSSDCVQVPGKHSLHSFVRRHSFETAWGGDGWTLVASCHPSSDLAIGDSEAQVVWTKNNRQTYKHPINTIYIHLYPAITLHTITLLSGN